MDLADRFAEAVAARGDAPLDLLALLIAAHADRRVDIDARLRQLDELAGRCPSSIEGVCDVLFGEVGLRGNTDDYNDPDNSYLDKVLDRRVGIPISLSVVLMEVGRRVGVPLVGIGAPGHFLVRLRDDGDRYIDAFQGGAVLDAEEACRLVGGRRPATGLVPLPTVDHRAIALRMLTNVKAVYAQRNDAVSLTWVLRLRLMLPGVDTVAERAELTRALAHFN